MPVRAMIWGEVGALSTTFKVPVRVLAAVGVNATLIVQLAPAARLLGQVPPVPNAKSPLNVHAGEVSRARVPVLVRVTYCVGLVVPT